MVRFIIQHENKKIIIKKNNIIESYYKLHILFYYLPFFRLDILFFIKGIRNTNKTQRNTINVEIASA